MNQPSLHYRHCMVVHNYYPLGEPRVQRQAEALAEAGVEVDVICLRRAGEPETEQEGAVRIVRLPVRRDKERGIGGQFLEYLAFFVLAFFRLTQMHLGRRYNIVQVHNLPDFLVFAALIPRLMGARIILDLHDLMPEFFLSRFGGNENAWPVRLIRMQERWSCRFAHHVITVTKLWRESLIERGVPAQKCSVVMNVADHHLFRPQPDVKPPPAAFHLIYHGNITHRYGVDLLLQAVAQARKEIPNLRLTIHGRGEYLPAVRSLVSELQLDDIVHLSTDLIPMAALPPLLASAHAGVVPYRRDVFTDGILPTKLMEYAALNLPAIVARTPVIEAYFAEDMLVFFEPEDVEALTQHIIDLSRDPERRALLAQSIRHFNQAHSWAIQKQDYLALAGRLSS